MVSCIWFRFCPQGIPSGKNQEDVLAEVRKEAFNAKKSRSTAGGGDGDEEEEAEELSALSEGTCPVLTEDWEEWYPQEWIGWVMYGVPSELPTEHWVNQPTSEGPTDTEHFITDESGKRVSKKPPGRNHQRDRETTDSVVNKTTSDSNTMMSHRLIQVDQELLIAKSSHNLRIIELMMKNANTDEEIDEANDCYKEYLLHESTVLKQTLAANRALREKELSQRLKPTLTTPLPAVPMPARVLSTARNMPATNTPDQENENYGESIKSLYSLRSLLFLV